jgi:SOS-response transcriptional repressor LexA
MVSLKSTQFGMKSAKHTPNTIKALSQNKVTRRYPAYIMPSSRRELMMQNMQMSIHREMITTLAPCKYNSPIQKVNSRIYTSCAMNKSNDGESQRALKLQQSSYDNSTFEATSLHMSTREGL